ncbi:MAG: hypothetical protein ACOX9C_08375 [Kiritimatiellia bacterium]|jgi:predicted amidophosphoribosyltransferase
MKKRVGYGAYHCALCGERLQAMSSICPGCGADQNSTKLHDKRPRKLCSEEEEKRRVSRYRRNEVVLKMTWGLTLAVGVPCMLLATGEIELDPEGRIVSAVLFGMFFAIAVVSSIRGLLRKSRIHASCIIDSDETACDACGSVNDMRNGYCARCGCALHETGRSITATNSQKKGSGAEAALYCEFCGKKTTEGSNFCESCGAKLQ